MTARLDCLAEWYRDSKDFFTKESFDCCVSEVLAEWVDPLAELTGECTLVFT